MSMRLSVWWRFLGRRPKIPWGLPCCLSLFRCSFCLPSSSRIRHIRSMAYCWLWLRPYCYLRRIESQISFLPSVKDWVLQVLKPMLSSDVLLLSSESFPCSIKIRIFMHVQQIKISKTKHKIFPKNSNALATSNLGKTCKSTSKR